MGMFSDVWTNLPYWQPAQSLLLLTDSHSNWSSFEEKSSLNKIEEDPLWALHSLCWPFNWLKHLLQLFLNQSFHQNRGIKNYHLKVLLYCLLLNYINVNKDHLHHKIPYFFPPCCILDIVTSRLVTSPSRMVGSKNVVCPFWATVETQQWNISGSLEEDQILV